ncbi:thiol S-methyltransferase METTL7B-like [Mercenaria mercenaria]|uniref:thiol S-methyltransferase METTL7B-like n=1 Tax=Mercenaria mercenaria TaxID=6596 RepID=UPI001E1DC034|nr:thiol S-methyltransferase METTL7B-like [Mercenaria mercenaria]
MEVEYSNMYTAVSFFAILGLAWCLRRPFRFHILQRISARKINGDTSFLNKLLWKEKVEMFQFLYEYKENSNTNLTVLDVGSGPAANLAFLPKNTKLVCLDPNPHLKGYIDENLKKCDNDIDTDIVQGYAENMPFENELFDATICTVALCVVQNIEKSLDEIKRVLKPGGKLFFLEHVTVEDKRLYTYLLWCAMIPLARLLYGCHVTRDTVKSIKNAGFSDLRLQYVYPKTDIILLRKCIIGVATK